MTCAIFFKNEIYVLNRTQAGDTRRHIRPATRRRPRALARRGRPSPTRPAAGNAGKDYSRIRSILELIFWNGADGRGRPIWFRPSRRRVFERLPVFRLPNSQARNGHGKPGAPWKNRRWPGEGRRHLRAPPSRFHSRADQRGGRNGKARLRLVWRPAASRPGKDAALPLRHAGPRRRAPRPGRNAPI